MKFGRMLTPWKALIAVVAIFATTQSAKADLYLTITEATNPGNTITVNTSSSNHTTLSGYTFDYTATTSPLTGPTGRQVSLDATVTSNGTFRLFNLTLFSSTSNGLTPADTPATATSGLFSAIGSSGTPLYLSSSLDVQAISGSGSSVSTSAAYDGYGGGIRLQHQDQAAPLFGTSTGSQNSGKTAFNQAPGTTSFNLSSMSIDVQNTGAAGSQIHFISTATVALPEPSGVAAAVAGLPFMGLLVGLMRRRRALAEAVNAA